MTPKLETVVLESLVGSEEFTRKAIPFIKEEYFDSRVERVLFNEIQRFFNEHNQIPTQKILKLFIEDSREFKQDEYNDAIETVNSFSEPEKNMEWLLNTTEKWCKDKALYTGIMTAISILDGRNDKLNPDAIPSLLQDALGVCFDKNVGHDIFNDAESRFDFYHLKEDRIPFDLEMFNRITKGGLPRKTLNVILASTGCGKSLFMCHHAAATLRQGKNVLYITLEMAEERIAERIDCNMLDVQINDLHKMSRSDFKDKVKSIESKTSGRMVVKEYPTSSAHVGHFRILLEELKAKQNFKPDMIYIDYINICASQRYKAGANYNSYFAVKSIAEEIRGLAVEYDVSIMSATQTTRSGIGNSDVELTDTSESVGLPATVDLMFALIRTDELDAMGQIMVKQLKSRYNDIGYYKKFVVGIDLAKFRLYDVDNAPGDLVGAGKTDDDVPLFDKSKFGSRMRQNNDFNKASEIDYS